MPYLRMVEIDDPRAMNDRRLVDLADYYLLTTSSAARLCGSTLTASGRAALKESTDG